MRKNLNVFESYAKLNETAIRSNILTFEDFKVSDLYHEYWIACFELAKCMVKYGVFNINTELAKSLKAFDDDDLVMELTMLLVKRFESHVKTACVKENDHNYRAYASQAFRNMVLDFQKKYALKEKVKVVDEKGKTHNLSVNVKKSEEGNEVNVYISHIYGDTPLSDDDSANLWDTIAADESNNPEYSYFDEVRHLEGRNNVFTKYFKELAGKKRYLGCLYIFIQDIFAENDIESALPMEYMIQAYEMASSQSETEAVNALFIRTYNEDLEKFLDFAGVSNKDRRAIAGVFASSIDSFGRNFSLSTDKVHKLRSEYKIALREMWEKKEKDKRNLSR